jgi:hypothetical protein
MRDKIKTFGFFGDSFCTKLNNPHSIEHGYQTYIEQTRDYYNANIVNLGYGGSSVWDALLIQLQPLIASQSIPDVCVFVWTNSGRLFNRTARSIHASSGIAGYRPEKEKWFETEYPGKTNPFTKDLWEAAKQFYLYLYDQEKEEIEHRAILEYIDNNVLSTFPSSIKIIHFWAFGNPKSWDFDGFHPNSISYNYKWKHGVEIRPALNSLSIAGDAQNTFQYPKIDDRPNHLEGVKNTMVFQFIKNAIDEYEDGKILNYSNDISVMWNND